MNLNFFERLKAPTPKFFKILMAWGGVIAAAGTAVLAFEVPLPEIIKTIAGYLIAIGGAMMGIGKLTVDHTKVTPKPTPEKDDANNN